MWMTLLSLLFFVKCVDDIILIEDNMVEMNHLKKCLAAEFEIKNLGALRYFLGMEVA